jgi:hypothetical protein
MSERQNDLDRARELGMSVEEFQALVGHDPLETHIEFLNAGVVGPKDTRQADDSNDVKLKEEQKEKKKKAEVEKTEAGGPYSLHDEFTDVTGIGDGTTVPFQTDEDVNKKMPEELENYWDRPVTSPEDQALYYGFHIHTKDNMYGLHAHYPGGPLGGGHRHTAQNKQGYHTHRYNNDELLQFKFARPGVMIQLDGPHVHQQNAPDGKHTHSEENFGPASGRRAEKVAERNRQADTN